MIAAEIYLTLFILSLLGLLRMGWLLGDAREDLKIARANEGTSRKLLERKEAECRDLDCEVRSANDGNISLQVEMSNCRGRLIQKLGELSVALQTIRTLQLKDGEEKPARKARSAAEVRRLMDVAGSEDTQQETADASNS